MGLVTFEAKPPFGITRLAPDPIQRSDENSRPKNHEGKFQGISILFPAGAFLVGDKFIISSGVHDSWIEVTTFQRKELESRLVKVNRK
jgi:predicted GH43/DUF377 family glycosyl hydrolase